MAVIDTLIDAGLTLKADGERLLVNGPLTDPLRDLIRRNKSELLIAAAEAERLTAVLIASINRCCDVRGDDDHNRTGLIAECRALPPRAQADLREHFEQEGNRWEAFNPTTKKACR